MAVRPVFISEDQRPYGPAQMVDFTWYSGFSKAQKQRSVASLHECFMRKFPGRRVLEISSKSTEPLGVALSAFNLKSARTGSSRWRICIRRARCSAAAAPTPI